MIVIRHCQSNTIVGKSTNFEVQDYHIETYQVRRRESKKYGCWIISADVSCSESTVIAVHVQMKTCIGEPSFKLDMLVEEKERKKEFDKKENNRISKSFVKYELLKNAKEYIFKTRIGASVNHGFHVVEKREDGPLYDIFVDLTQLLGNF